MIKMLSKGKKNFIGASKISDELNRAALNGYTPMHFACGTGNVNMVKFMVKYGANIEKPGKSGINALHLASMQGQLTTVRYLL